MLHDGAQVAGLLVNTKLALCAGAFVENGVNVLDGAAAAEFVDDIVDKGEELDCEIAHGHFSFFAEVDEFAFDAVARGPPFVFFDECAAVDAEAHITGVKAVQLHDNGLGEGGDGDGFFDLGGDVAHTELKSAERGMGANVPPDFLAAVDAVELDEETKKIFVGAPGLELFGHAGAREAAENGGAERFQAGVAAHPEGRTGGEREQVREEIADHVHHVDGGLFVGHGDVNVHAKNQQGTRELLEFFDNVLVTLAGRNDLVDATGEGVGACGGDLQSGALGGSNQFTTCAMHLDTELADVFANFRAGLDDGLMHLVLDLFDDVRRSGGDELHHVRAELAGSGINNLKFFFYADGEAVSHEVALRDLELWGLLARIIPLWCGKYIFAAPAADMAENQLRFMNLLIEPGLMLRFKSLIHSDGRGIRWVICV